MVAIEIVKADVVDVDAEVLLLKHAYGFHGADESVFLRLEQATIVPADFAVDEGQSICVTTNGAVAARQALFIGTCRLGKFRYREIRRFARLAIELIAMQNTNVPTIATTIHGAGYGLDVEESFQAMIMGFQQGLAEFPIPSLQKIIFVERHPRRFEILEGVSSDMHLVNPKSLPLQHSANTSVAPSATTMPLPAMETASPPQETKRIAFVAMPFSEAFEDVYQFGIYQTVRKCGLVCEKVDESLYAGSIVERIMDGIRNCEFVIADLTEERPNVYLEVGFAWGLNKPVVLIAREGQRLHFDLSHHKCLFYSTIGKLADQLEKVIRDLFLSKSPSNSTWER